MRTHLLLVALAASACGGTELGATRAAAATNAEPRTANLEPLFERTSNWLLGPGDPQAGRTRVVISPFDPSVGPDDALVTIVEFSDPECGSCARAAETLRELEKLYPGELRFVWKQYPMRFHDDAALAAQAGLAAAAQGRFAEFRALVLANQDALDRASLLRYAERAGLDVDRFAASLDSGTWRWKVESDLALGHRLAVKGTPTFFINGIKFAGAKSIDRFRALIDSELAYANELIRARGLHPRAVYTELMRGARVIPDLPPRAGLRGGRPLTTGFRLPADDVPARGRGQLEITLFGDYQCSVTRAYAKRLRELASARADVRTAFRHLPDERLHAGSELAATAAIAAASQGEFWPFHDRLIEMDPTSIARDRIDALARDLGLDSAAFRHEIDSRAGLQQLELQRRLADALGIRRGPALVVGDRVMIGLYPWQEIEAAIEQARPAGELPVMEPYRLPPKRTPSRKQIALELDDAPSRGSADAPVTIVYFGNLQCPACRRLAPAIDEVLARYPDRVRVVFKHYPSLADKAAVTAAVAGLAAHRQGRFWELYAEAMKVEGKLTRSQLEEIAARLGLDMAQFRGALDDPASRSKLEAEVDQAESVGVASTPALIIDGRRIDGFHEAEDLIELIERQLAH